jgi:hypothetical protein
MPVPRAPRLDWVDRLCTSTCRAPMTEPLVPITPINSAWPHMRSWSSRSSHTHLILCDSVIFLWRSVIILYCQSFCRNKLNHFTTLNSSIFTTLLSYFMILLQWTQSFSSVILLPCQPFLLHQTKHFYFNAQPFYDFAIVNSVILWSYQPFCYIELIHFVTVLRSVFFVQCSDQPFLYSTPSFLSSCQPLYNSDINYFLQCSIIFTELSHFTRVLGHFMTLSNILEILSNILLQCIVI